MLSLAFFLAASCPEPKMVNVTPYPWNQFDLETLERAKKRCGQLYQGRSPCVKLYRKWGEFDYSVVCGRPR